MDKNEKLTPFPGQEIEEKPIKAQETLPPAPEHLSAERRTLWEEITEVWALESDELELLDRALVSLDRAEEARQVIESEGLTFTDRFGQPKPRPEVAIERNAVIVAARILRQLDLREELPRKPGRPPEGFLG